MEQDSRAWNGTTYPGGDPVHSVDVQVVQVTSLIDTPGREGERERNGHTEPASVWEVWATYDSNLMYNQSIYIAQ